MKYRIVVRSSSSELERDVNLYITEGYELIGGVSITLSSSYNIMEYAQAIIKKEVQPNEVISDGFGSEWSAYCAMCGEKTMQVVRPGKVQCAKCG